MASTLPKGIRLNNPLNIEANAIQWEGLTPKPLDTGPWPRASFVTHLAGLRAGGVLLFNYREYYGLSNIVGLVDRFEEFADPVSRNNYIQTVADESGIGATQIIDPRNSVTLWKLLKGFTRAENGYKNAILRESWYTDADYQTAALLAVKSKGAS